MKDLPTQGFYEFPCLCTLFQAISAGPPPSPKKTASALLFLTKEKWLSHFKGNATCPKQCFSFPFEESMHAHWDVHIEMWSYFPCVITESNATPSFTPICAFGPKVVVRFTCKAYMMIQLCSWQMCTMAWYTVQLVDKCKLRFLQISLPYVPSQSILTVTSISVFCETCLKPPPGVLAVDGLNRQMVWL